MLYHEHGTHGSFTSRSLERTTMQPRGRRSFLKSSARGSSFILLDSRTAFGSRANSAPEIGLIGCGSRGTWIVPFFQEYGAEVVALADVFRDNLEATKSKIKSPSARTYVGRNAYRELISSKLDGVVIEVPPYFFPEMVRTAVDARKHVYLAKPVAVDVPGCRVIEDCGRKAEGKTSCGSTSRSARAMRSRKPPAACTTAISAKSSSAKLSSSSIGSPSVKAPACRRTSTASAIGTTTAHSAAELLSTATSTTSTAFKF